MNIEMNLKEGMKVKISNNINKSLKEIYDYDGIESSQIAKFAGKLATVIEVEPPDVCLSIDSKNDCLWLLMSDIRPIINHISKPDPVMFDPINLYI